MPSLDNNGMDDQLLLDGTLAFTDGQFSYSKPGIIPEKAFVSATNMDFDLLGGIVTRRGADQQVGNPLAEVWEEISGQWQATTKLWSNTFVAPIRDIFYFDSSAGEYIAAADGSNVIKFSSESTNIVAASGATYTGENVYFAQLTDRLYYCDGSAALRYITSGQVNTSITAGRITGVEITVNGSGYTSAPAISASVGSGATFLATLGPGGTVAIVTVTAGGTGYSNASLLTIGSAPGSGVSATAIPRVSGLPSMPKLLVSHTNRLFCVSNSGSPESQDTLYVSDILDGESWDVFSNSIRIGGGDGDPITAIHPWYGFKLIVFKERSIWAVDANPSIDVSEWAVTLISSVIGCIAHKTVKQVGSDMFFLSREGVQSLSTIESGAQTGVSLPLSAQVHDKIASINSQYSSLCSAIYYRNRYMLSYPTDGAGIEETLVYNTLAKAWCGTWLGWKPRAFAVTGFGGKIRLSFGDEQGRLFTWLDYASDTNANESYYLDQGSPYSSIMTSKSYGFGESYVDKFGYQVQFGLDNSFDNSQLVNFAYILNRSPADGEILTEDNVFSLLSESDSNLTDEYISPFSTDVSIPKLSGLFRKSFNLQSIGRFTEIQFKMQAESGRLSFHNIKASAFADTIRPER